MPAHQAAVEQDRGAVEGVLDLALQAHIAPLGAEVAAQQVGQVAGQDLPQPADELGLAAPAEAREVLVRLQERLLDEVGGIDLALEALADLHPGQQGQVAPVHLQQSPERGGVAGPRSASRFSGSSVMSVAIRGSPRELVGRVVGLPPRGEWRIGRGLGYLFIRRAAGEDN